jgi:hypothetical protein
MHNKPLQSTQLLPLAVTFSTLYRPLRLSYFNEILHHFTEWRLGNLGFGYLMTWMTTRWVVDRLEKARACDYYVCYHVGGLGITGYFDPHFWLPFLLPKFWRNSFTNTLFWCTSVNIGTVIKIVSRPKHSLAVAEWKKVHRKRLIYVDGRYQLLARRG